MRKALASVDPDLVLYGAQTMNMRDRRNVPRHGRLHAGVVCLTHRVLFVCPGRFRPRRGCMNALHATR